ncbi:NAChRbeta2 [Trichonephila clavata]|uniref:NAChRbeta2 n=1 Tax=Trichonephila clavata TaxID=2740835 RepID=A0A8X6LIE4_TRICU|nr:NAChRbeta2 [Trichonephila clavata]
MRSPQYTDHHTHRHNSDRKKETSKIKSKKSQKQTDVPIDAKVARMIRESSSSLLDLRSPRSSIDDPGIVIRELDSSPGVVERRRYPRQILKSIHNAMFIAQHIDNEDDFDTVSAKSFLFLKKIVQ